jgi:pimeloyl-ACP methyl ester carboxylesterase
MKPHTAVISYQGNLQTGESQSGIEDVFFVHVRHFAGKDVTTYHPRRWNSDLDNLFWQLVRQKVEQVVLVGYSWGAGYTCMKFARMAEKFNITIPLALLCDPVYRPLWMPAWLPPNPLNIYSLDRRTKIRVPRTVRRAVYVRQEDSIPNGHELVPECPLRTQIHFAGKLDASHLSIDESPEWFDLVHKELHSHFTNGIPSPTH